MPFPYDAISQIAVELAPADVAYGGFSACNINAVTKSGSNRFAGNLFFEHTSDDLRGSSGRADVSEAGRTSREMTPRGACTTIQGHRPDPREMLL